MAEVGANTENETSTIIKARNIDGGSIGITKTIKSENIWQTGRNEAKIQHQDVEFTSKPAIGMVIDLKDLGYYEVAEPLSPAYRKQYPNDVFLKRIGPEDLKQKKPEERIEDKYTPLTPATKTALGLTQT